MHSVQGTPANLSSTACGRKDARGAGDRAGGGFSWPGPYCHSDCYLAVGLAACQIEVVSEMWFTGTSRQEVLDRLESSYRDGMAEGLSL